MALANGDKWREKLRPIFFEVAAANRSFERSLKEIEVQRDRELKALGENATAEQRRAIANQAALRGEELSAEMGRTLEQIQQRHPNVPYNPLPYSYLHPPTGEQEDDVTAFFRYLHFNRHQESLHSTYQRDGSGDLSAWDALHRTGTDFRLLAIRKEPIKPFKVDVPHRELLQMIMLWEVKPLTADERAACFDEFCACGVTTHDADALKKQLNRLKKDLRR